MKSVLLFAGILVAYSANGFASGKTLVVCSGSTFKSGLEKVAIHQDVGGQMVALYTTESTGGSYPTFAYPVVQKPVPQGQMGAGLTYVGKGLVLHVNTDGPGGSQGLVGYLSIAGFQIRNERLSCKVNFN